MATNIYAESTILAIDSLPLRRFTVAENHALGDAGVLGENDRVELLDGVLVMMSSISPPHAYVVSVTHDELSSRVPERTYVRIQQPVTLSTSEPQPDLAIVKGSNSTYRTRHPGPSDILILIEVADATSRTDRMKAHIYAAAQIPEYWIIDLADRSIETLSDPRSPRGTSTAQYATKRILKSRDDVTVSIAKKKFSVRVKSLLT